MSRACFTDSDESAYGCVYARARGFQLFIDIFKDFVPIDMHGRLGKLNKAAHASEAEHLRAPNRWAACDLATECGACSRYLTYGYDSDPLYGVSRAEALRVEAAARTPLRSL
jgi:hypothetical protein